MTAAGSRRISRSGWPSALLSAKEGRARAVRCNMGQLRYFQEARRANIEHINRKQISHPRTSRIPHRPHPDTSRRTDPAPRRRRRPRAPASRKRRRRATSRTNRGRNRTSRAAAGGTRPRRNPIADGRLTFRTSARRGRGRPGRGGTGRRDGNGSGACRRNRIGRRCRLRRPRAKGGTPRSRERIHPPPAPHRRLDPACCQHSADDVVGATTTRGPIVTHP